MLQGGHRPANGQKDSDSGRDTSQLLDDSKQELNDDTGQPDNANGQDEYLWINRQVFESLIAQLDKKDEQIGRKDGQVDELLQRNREANVLLKNYQDNYGLLAEPKREDEKTEGCNESH